MGHLLLPALAVRLSAPVERVRHKGDPLRYPTTSSVTFAGSGNSAAQWGQRVAPSFTSSRQKGHIGSLVMTERALLLICMAALVDLLRDGAACIM